MKILFIISTIGQGKGGHFHSLNHISRELSKKHECKIITIGPGRSQIISKSPLFLMNLRLKGVHYISFLKQVKEVIKNESPEIIHFFDVYSYNILRFALNPNKQKICITKCGGKNPIWFPFVKNIILFSLENLNWFNNKKRYKKTNIAFIPNRVNRLKLNINYRPIQKKIGDFNFVRICRIGKIYEKSIMDSILLVDKLRDKGYHEVKLFIIGYIEDIDFYNQLTESIKNKTDYIHVITSPEITNEASRMLYLADVVIGTGRGIMEAASLKIPILTLNADDNFPVLVDSTNFIELFETNFSQRGSIKGFDKHDNIAKIERLLTDKKYYHELSLFSEKVFNEYFSIKKINKNYSSFYNKAMLGTKKSFLDILYAIRHILSFIKLSNKRVN